MATASSQKAVILVGGPHKGTRFRPLSLCTPKPLFIIAGLPLIEHHIAQLCALPNLAEIFISGFYAVSEFTEFIARWRARYSIAITYLHEINAIGTAGGLIAHQDEILRPVGAPRAPPTAVFVLNCDVCGDLPLKEMVVDLETRGDAAAALMLTTSAPREESLHYGSVVMDNSHRVLHYVDKPETFVSTSISCGIYLVRPSVFTRRYSRTLSNGLRDDEDSDSIWFENDIFPAMASAGTLFAHHTERWWSQTKTPHAALYANRHYLALYHSHCPQRLAEQKAGHIIGDVFIDASAIVHPTAKLGSNVSISANVVIGEGVRIKESIILPDCVIEKHCCVLYSVIGWRSVLGPWTRIEGTPIAPNPNVPFARLANEPLFDANTGRLNPSLTIIGPDCKIRREIVILNSIIMPSKDLKTSHMNTIVM